MKENITPEEKLLRLIKGKKQQSEKQQPGKEQPEKQPAEGQSAVRLPGVRPKTIGIRHASSPSAPRLNIAGIKKYLVMNPSKMLMFLLIGVIVYFTLDTVVITPHFRQQIRDIEVQPEPVTPAGQQAGVTGSGCTSISLICCRKWGVITTVSRVK